MIWSRVLAGRLHMVRNALLPRRGRGSRGATRYLLGGSLAVVVAFLIAIGLAALFGQLAEEGATAGESAVLLGLILTAAVTGLLVFDLHEGVSVLVADSDLELLRRAPLRGGEIFTLKLIDALPRTSLLLVILAIPAVLAFHAFYPLPLWAWLAIPILLLALWAIPLGLGSAAALLLLLGVPARRAREALGLLSTLVLFLLWLANSFLLPRLAEGDADPLAGFRAALTDMAPIFRVSPGAWTADALAAAASGSFSGWVGAVALLLATAALSMGTAAFASARLLETVQLRVASATGGRATVRSPRRAAPSTRHPSFLRAVLARDWRLLMRDWTVMGDVLTAAVLWTLLPLVGAPVFGAPVSIVARAMLVALTVGLGYEVAARAFPFERRGLVWTRLAPVGASRWVAAKWVATAALSLPLVTLAATSMTLTLGLSGRELIDVISLALPALGLSLSVGLWTGAQFGDPNWSSPRAMLTASGRVIATLLLLFQATAWLIFAALVEARASRLPPGFLFWGPVLLAALAAVIPLRAAAARIAAREWTV
jgi:hypothetical protein